MKRWLLTMLLFLVSACGREPISPAAAPTPIPAPAEAAGVQGSPAVTPAADDQITMQGIDLRMYDVEPTLGTAGKPTFRVQAGSGSMQGQGVWRFEDAHAVIYAHKEGTEDMLLDAARGRFEQDLGAFLEGGLTARIGTMRLELEDLEWVNKEQEARSDKPVQMVDGKTHLTGDTIRLYPSKRTFVLTHAKGVIQFDKEEP